MALALLLSLLVHALLLSLTFGADELGLPGLALPWRDRRVEAPELRVMLAPPQVTAAGPATTAQAQPLQPLQPAAIETPTAQLPSVNFAPPSPQTADPAAPPAIDAEAALRADLPQNRPLAAIPEPASIALQRLDENSVVVSATPAAPQPVVAAARTASSPESLEAERVAAERLEAARRDAARQAAALREAAQQESARQQAARIEAARLEADQREADEQEAERQEAARLLAARQALVRQEAARQEAARVEAARLDAERQEAARRAAAQQEIAQQEAARRQAATVEAARQEAEREAAAQQEATRREAARQEAAKTEAARQAAARQEASRQQAAQDDEERRLAARRAMGKQLDAEAAQRDAAATANRLPGTLPSSWSSARRGRLFGRSDPNAELVLYAEAWARKIQFNTAVDVVSEAARRPHIDPLVTVAIRRDGSVESVTFVLSSGVAEVDETIRRIVRGNVPYPAFSPALAGEFDVIEIRRTWHFDTAVRLY